MNAWLFNPRGEFRLVLLYGPAVLFFAVLANVNYPVLEVIWDMVFYKTMAHGLFHWNSFDLKRHFPVPPLYPLILAPANFAPSYLWIERIQSWIDPAVYFLSLFPLYWLSRLILGVRESVIVCFLFLLYPTSIYTQWTLSENLAIPLTILAAWLGSRLLLDKKPLAKDGIYLGIVLAGLVLTRVQAIIIVAAILGGLNFRWYKRWDSPAPFWIPFGAFAALVVSVWWWFGYLAADQFSFFYSDVKWGKSNSPFFSILLNRFWAHVTALWLEGALLIPTLAVVVWLKTSIIKSPEDRTMKTVSNFLLFLSLAVIVSVSFYRSMRADMELWSVSLRHACYGNLILIPLGVAGMDHLTSLTRRNRIILVSILAGTVFVFAAGFWLPEVWPGLCNSHPYFTNAPSLDFMIQLKGETVWVGGSFLALLSLALGVVCLWNRYAGTFVLVVLFIYISGHTIDFSLKIRDRAVLSQHVDDMHAFCARLDAGEWKDIPIYCDERRESLYQSASIRYWVYRNANALPDGDPKPKPPFLYLTPNEQDGAELVMQLGYYRVYLFQNSP